MNNVTQADSHGFIPVPDDSVVDHTRLTRIARVGLWTLQAGAAAMFLLAGTLKLVGIPIEVQLFDTIGIGHWFRYVTGVIEVVGGVLILVPSLAAFAAVPLAITMVGAILTHLFIVGGSPAIPLALLAATLTIAWARR